MGDSSIIVALVSAGGAIIVAGLGLIGNIVINGKKTQSKDKAMHDEVLNTLREHENALLDKLKEHSAKLDQQDDKLNQQSSKLDQQNTKMDLMVSGEKHLLLRNLEKMTAEFKSYKMDDRKISDEEYKKFCEQYECYHSLGGNGYATGLKNLVDQIYADGKLSD